MDGHRQRTVMKSCVCYEEGLIGIDDFAINVVCWSAESTSIAEHLALVPVHLMSVITEWLHRQPKTDDGWIHYDRFCMLDGDEYAWLSYIEECRTGVEAARLFLFGEKPAIPDADFTNKVLEVYRLRINKLR